jgi:hypothetical protein
MFVVAVGARGKRFPRATGFWERFHTCKPTAACEEHSQPAIYSCADSPPFPSRKLAEINSAAELVKLCFFVGFTQEQAAKELGVSVSTAEWLRVNTRAQVFRAMRKELPPLAL